MEVLKIRERNELYPKRLKEIKNHPKEIYAIGDISILDKSCVSIVGSRDMDKYGLDQTRRFSSFLSQKNICIISGLAKGIDTVAHYYAKDKVRKNCSCYCIWI